MKNLLNLLKLNYYSLLAMGKSLIFGLLLGVGYHFFGDMFLFIGPATLLLILNYSPIAYEEKSKMNSLIYLLPVQPNKYILSKYIYCIINTFIIVIISNIINVIIGILNIGNNTTFGILTVTILFIGFLVVAIVVPITIIVGFNKGRYILGFLAIAPACMAKAFAEIFTGITLSTSYTTIKTIIILSCIIFTIVSYFITVSLYSKKEIE